MIPKVLCRFLRCALPSLVFAGMPAIAGTEGPAQGSAQPPVSFNFQVQPILANNCYACHGPDEKKRKAKLRLDVAAEAHDKGAWKPGNAAESEGIKRLFSTDPEEVMPPPEFHSEITEADREILKQWVNEGARYEKHWAFLPPVMPEVPKFLEPQEPAKKEAEKPGKSEASRKKPVQTQKEPGKLEKKARNRGAEAAPSHFPIRHPIDSFVLDKMLDEGLLPAGKATPEQWLRRVTFDLTGLPPTRDEVDAFLKDESGESCERVVDRLLASPAYGERMAADWLDAARYADSYGRHEDADSAVWPYRDWVISAFNRNLPYDQFLTWQTAGDLLPGSTPEMKLATTFNRLVNQSNEAGSNEEEFRHEIVADRVNTNGTAILGLSMECARCHDHKYDPISMRDYYGMAAFLNNIDELGLYAERTAGIPAPSMYLFTEAEQQEHDRLTARIKEAEEAVARIAGEAKSRCAAHVSANGVPPAATPTDLFSMEHIVKKGEKVSRKMALNSARPDDAYCQFKFQPDYVEGLRGEGAVIEGENFLKIPGRGQFRRSDPFSFSFWIYPTQQQERAILLHRSGGGLEAASRGYEIILNKMHPEFSLSHVAPGNSIRIRGTFPIATGKWNHVVATYDGSSRAAGLKLYLNGHLIPVEVISDHLYKDITYRAEWGDFDPSKVQNNISGAVELCLGNRYNDMGPKGMTFDEFHIYPLVLTPAEVTTLHCGEVPDDEESAYQRYLRDVDKPYAEAVAALHATRTAEDDFVSKAREIMVMREREKPRDTFVLNRGKWDDPGAKVTAATPAEIWALPDDFPKNRLGLAQWYVDARNPLVSRVVVNRLWQQFFGRGLVATPEDLGIQGRLPSHPQLLDWLAVHFRQTGWDVKRFCRELVLSSTYRQSSHSTSRQSYEIDPANRFLSRGPRLRLSAEMLRDHALRAADLLNPEMGGKPVKPYQPLNLYADSGVQAGYTQDHGSVLWKRSVYLYRKRTLPLPFLTTFDASTREFCRVRRESTATPLQALTLLNAVDFVEPCRVLAEKQLARPNRPIGEILADSFRRFTGRSASAAELAVLDRMHGEQLKHYQAAPDLAQALVAAAGEFPVQKDLPAAAVAALTMVHRMMLSDDDSVMKK